jgi:hypothetical protein
MSRELQAKTVSDLLGDEDEFLYRAQRIGTPNGLPQKVVDRVGSDNIRKVIAGEMDFEDLQAAPADEVEPETYGDMKLDALRAEASSRGLEESGTKSELKTRLMENDQAQQAQEASAAEAEANAGVEE